MGQMISFEQFYYTNYEQGMRYEGSSAHDREKEDAVKLLAGSWMKLDTAFPVEMVAYNNRLKRYVAAMIVPCTKVGDTRSSYWIHAAVPKNCQTDGFDECLSWPLKNYQREVVLQQELSEVSFPAVQMPLEQIREKYGLTEDRLVVFMYMVWQTICGTESPSTLYFIHPYQGGEDHNRAAREIMALVYDILPESLRKDAGYQAWAESDINYVSFAFRDESASEWQFDLRVDAVADRGDISEEEQLFMELLAELYEKSPKQYKQVVENYYCHETDTFLDFVWNYYLDRVRNKKGLGLSQEALIKCQPYLEKEAVNNLDYRRLLCACLAAIDTKGKAADFVQQVTDKYILAAAGLAESDCQEYEDNTEPIWNLLDQLSDGDRDTAVSYLEWIKEQSQVFYEDFVRSGMDSGKQWILEILNDEEKKKLLPLCREQDQLMHRYMTQMSYSELLQRNQDDMNLALQNIWLQNVAGHLRNNRGLVNSPDKATELCEYIMNMDIVKKVLIPETVEVDRDAMNMIIAAIWKYGTELDIQIRYILCMLAQNIDDADFDIMTSEFWQHIRPEEFGKLAEMKGVCHVFQDSEQSGFHNYMIYGRYCQLCEKGFDRKKIRKKDREYFEHIAQKMLRGHTEPACRAICMYLLEQNNVDRQFTYNVLCCLKRKSEVARILSEYASQGEKKAMRLRGLPGVTTAAVDETSDETSDGAEKETANDPRSYGAERILPWVMTACIGLYMGLMVNGWYMAVHLSKILNLSFLVWIGVAGIALVTVLFMVFAEKLVREDVTVSLIHIPWAGLWLFINLVMSHFAGNKITAAISLILLAAAYIWMRIERYL